MINTAQNVKNMYQNSVKHAQNTANYLYKNDTYSILVNNMTKRVLVTFPDKLGKNVERVAEAMGMPTAELCRIATIEYMRTIRAFGEEGVKKE